MWSARPSICPATDRRASVVLWGWRAACVWTAILPITLRTAAPVMGQSKLYTFNVIMSHTEQQTDWHISYRDWYISFSIFTEENKLWSNSSRSQSLQKELDSVTHKLPWRKKGGRMSVLWFTGSCNLCYLYILTAGLSRVMIRKPRAAVYPSVSNSEEKRERGKTWSIVNHASAIPIITMSSARYWTPNHHLFVLALHAHSVGKKCKCPEHRQNSQLKT